MAVFLELNGWALEAPEPEVVRMMLAVASGELPEEELAAWVRTHSQLSSPPSADR
jgi:death-on-curing protein